MAIDARSPRSRRAILGAALGGAAAAAAQGLLAAAPVAADTGDPATLGQANTADAVTSVENTTDGQAALAGMHNNVGTGLSGSSVAGIGAAGRSTNTDPSDFESASLRTGLWGSVGDETDAATNTDETGVYGFSDVSSNSTGVWGDAPQGYGVAGTGDLGVFGLGSIGVDGLGDWGVLGDGDTAGVLGITSSGVGVYGASGNIPEPPADQTIGVFGAGSSVGCGVYGFAGDTAPNNPPDGVGVYARAASTSQTALYVSGKAKFTRSGVVALGSTSTSKTVTMSGVTTSSYVIATLQTSVSGVYVRAVVPASGSFKIYLSKAAGKTVNVGYLVIN